MYSVASGEFPASLDGRLLKPAGGPVQSMCRAARPVCGVWWHQQAPKKGVPQAHTPKKGCVPVAHLFGQKRCSMPKKRGVPAK